MMQDTDSDDVIWKVLSANPAYQTITIRILEKLIVPMFLGAFLIAFWPIALYMKYKTLTGEKEYVVMEEEHKFKVIHGDLLKQVSIQQVENLENVIDPLGAVPDLPFGHLNSAWVQFIEKVEDGDMLWSFTSIYTPGCGNSELRMGYTVVCEGVIGPWFISTMRTLDKEQEDEH